MFRHSGAHNAWVTLLIVGSQVVVKVRDDGKGIAEQTAKFRPGSVGVGVSGMRQRIKEFGGELLLQNANPGTLVQVSVPIRRDDSRTPVENSRDRKSKTPVPQVGIGTPK